MLEGQGRLFLSVAPAADQGTRGGSRRGSRASGQGLGSKNKDSRVCGDEEVREPLRVAFVVGENAARDAVDRVAGRWGASSSTT